MEGTTETLVEEPLVAVADAEAANRSLKQNPPPSMSIKGDCHVENHPLAHSHQSHDQRALEPRLPAGRARRGAQRRIGS